MARVVVSRGADTAGMFSRINVTIDGVQSASLLPLQRKELELSTGDHRIVANLGWAQSKTLELAVQEHDIVTLRVKAPWSPILKAMKSLGDVRNADVGDAILLERIH
jgi:hypothetical protein